MPPRQYEHIRDAYIAKGVGEKEAKKRAAMTYNSLHKGHPMHPGTHHASGGSVKRSKRPAALANPTIPPPMAPTGPMVGAGGAPPVGIKHGGHTKHFAHGGSTETPIKHNPLPGEEKDAHGKKVAMKRGGHTHSRGGGIARRGFSGGGYTRGDGIAQRGHTRGTCR